MNKYHSIIEHFSKYGLHPDVELTDKGIIQLRDHGARYDEKYYKEIDLNNFWLPPNSIYTHPTPLYERPSFIIFILEGVNFSARTSSPSKSKSARLAIIFTALVKFSEYLWLNDVYNFKSASKELLDRLPHLLATGGWHLALDVSNRLMEMLDLIDDKDHKLFNHTSGKHSVNAKILKQLLGTNLAGKEASKYLNHLKNFQIRKGWLKSDISEETEENSLGMNYSLLKITLEALNKPYYSRILATNTPIPYPDYIRLSKKLTATPGNTPHFESHYAGSLLEACISFLYERTDVVFEMLTFATDEIKKCQPPTNANQRIFFNRISCKSKELGFDKATNFAFGLDHINNLGALNRVIRAAYSACFINIAVFNARRKDEILHKKFGIHWGCCSAYSERLRVFELDIYIEKTVKDYVHFYVGDLTWESVRFLEKLYTLFFTEPQNKKSKEDTLFRHKIFSWNGLTTAPTNFNFETYVKGQSYHFITEVADLPPFPKITAHMFRKLYCTVYINQHEYAHLPALSQQLQHGELSTTQIYISAPQIQNAAATISKFYDWDLTVNETIHDQYNLANSNEMEEAKNIKLGEIIYNILSNTPSSGGYRKFVISTFKKFHSSIDFENLDDQQKISILIEKLKTRGHSPTPFRHSQCMVGTTKVKSRSKCWEPVKNALNKALASPHLCSKCPFSSTSALHLENMQLDEITLTEQVNCLAPRTVEWINQTAELENLRSAILLHQENLRKNK